MRSAGVTTMADIHSYSSAFQDPGNGIPDGSTIYGGQFRQLAPGTVIMAGKLLIIHGGNWINVAKDPAWTVLGGNWCQKNYCANKHPNLISKGLSAEAENCPHVIDTDEIWVDSVLIDTVYYYQDEVVS